MSDKIAARLTAAVREADVQFESVGGSSRHYVNDCLLPALEKGHLAVVDALVPVHRDSAERDVESLAEKLDAADRLNDRFVKAYETLLALPPGSLAEGNRGESWSRVVETLDALRSAVADSPTFESSEPTPRPEVPDASGGTLGMRFVVISKDGGEHRSLLMQVAPIPEGLVAPLPSAVVHTGVYESVETFMEMIKQAVEAGKMCWPEAISSEIVEREKGGLPH